MALDPGTIASGVATGIVTNKTIEATNKAASHLSGKGEQPSETQQIINLLEQIHTALDTPEKTNRNFPMNLQVYPNEYVIDDNLMGRPHICVFFFVSTPVRFDGIYGGTYTKTVGPGWVQIDIPGRLYTTDVAHPVIISYRHDALGAAF